MTTFQVDVTATDLPIYRVDTEAVRQMLADGSMTFEDDGSRQEAESLLGGLPFPDVTHTP